MITTDALHTLFNADIAATTGGGDHYTTQATLSLSVFAKEPLPVKFFADDVGWDDFLPALSATTALRDIAKTAAQEELFANFLMIYDALSVDYPTPEAVLVNEGAGREFDDLRVP